MTQLRDRLPRLSREWFLITRGFGISGPLREEDARREAGSVNRYLLYRQISIKFSRRLAGWKGNWQQEGLIRCDRCQGDFAVTDCQPQRGGWRCQMCLTAPSPAAVASGNGKEHL